MAFCWKNSFISDAASPELELVVVPADPHEAVLSPLGAPTVLDKPVLFASRGAAVLTEAHDRDCVVEALVGTAATLS